MTVAQKPHTEVARRLTADEAWEKGLVRMGEEWDEELQRAVPFAQAHLERRMAEPEDVARNLAVWQKNRDALLSFIRDKLTESEYGDKGYPVGGKMHDFYKLPSYDKRALTKQGAEKLAQLFNLRRATTETVERVATKECALAVCRVTLVDQYRRPAGSGEAACSTAETSFQRAEKKYGGDYRAALNDVIARAGKRAFVQAVIYAIAGDEIFEASEVPDDEDVQKEAVAPPAAGVRFPAKFGKVGGKLVSEVSDTELTKIAEWCRTKAKNPKAVQPILDAVTDELEHRRLENDGGEDLPF